MSASELDFVPVSVPRPDKQSGKGGRPVDHADERLQGEPASPQARSMRLLREQHARLRERTVAGRRDAIGRQRALGKLTARERLDLLLDKDSFTEIDRYRRHQVHGWTSALHRRRRGSYDSVTPSASR